MLFCLCVFSSNAATQATQKTKPAATQKAKIAASSEITAGYNALILFLQNQEYLTTMLNVRTFLLRQHISEDSEKLISTISKSSSKALQELDKLALKEPTLAINEFPDSIGLATFDSLRMTTAKELVFDSKNFEKNLLLTQTQVLRVISHLAEELRDQEPNKKRRVWLAGLAEDCEKYYGLVYKRIDLAYTLKK